jgi:hypothetical protein
MLSVNIIVLERMVYLVNAVISEALLGRELAVLLSLVAAHHTHRRASPPVITLRSLLEQPTNTDY